MAVCGNHWGGLSNQRGEMVVSPVTLNNNANEVSEPASGNVWEERNVAHGGLHISRRTQAIGGLDADHSAS